MKLGLKYGAGLIAIYLGVRYGTGAGKVLSAGASGGTQVIKAFQGR